ncbi:hypothetical protein J3R82DRAFT_6742 [Butyriboletus roseoflavus]|nr:hypothetical protein J3R82DRAFT_6742 [Butyriboletus roseoflavus]
MAILDNSQSKVQNAIQKIEDRDRINHGEIMTKVSSFTFLSRQHITHDLQRIQHSDHLLGLLPAIHSSITFELSTALALIKDESLRNIDMAAHLERRLGFLEGSLSAMQNSLEQLIGLTKDSSKALETSLAHAQTAQVIQGDTMVSMAQLVDTVYLLTQTTHAEIASINRTASVLKESLNRTPVSEWLKAVLVSLLQLFPERFHTRQRQKVVTRPLASRDKGSRGSCTDMEYLGNGHQTTRPSACKGENQVAPTIFSPSILADTRSTLSANPRRRMALRLPPFCLEIASPEPTTRRILLHIDSPVGWFEDFALLCEYSFYGRLSSRAIM